MYIYHFVTTWQIGYSQTITDGIAQLENEILSMDDYIKFKETIRKTFNDAPENFAITSLSLLKGSV